MSTTAQTSSPSRMALLKRQGMPVEQVAENIAESDEMLQERFSGCLSGALAIRERYRPTGDRIPRNPNGKLSDEGQLVVTIVTKAVIEVEGQRTIVEDLDDVRTEARLREVAVFIRSWAGQALFDWTVENWIAIIKIIKRAGSKGATEAVLQTLLGGEEHWSPVLLLSWKLARREALGFLEAPDYMLPEVEAEIQRAVRKGEHEIQQTRLIFSLLTKGTAQASSLHIPGF